MISETESIPAPLRFNLINRTAARKYALLVSKQRKAGKFTRVSEGFLDGVEASLDAAIRAILADEQEGFIEPPRSVTTGIVSTRAREKLDRLAHAIIYRRVCRHPSLGCTLKD